MKLRFFNTYEPVTDFYRDLVPALADAGIPSEIVVSAAEYRAGRGSLADVLAPHGARVRMIAAGIAHAASRAQKVLVLGSYTLGGGLLALLGRGRPVNFFLTQPPLFSLVGRLLKALRGQRYCCLIMDLYPHVLAADGVIAEGRLAYRVMRAMARAAARGADRVFVIGRCMRDRLVEEGVAAERISVVHNWANEQQIRPVDRGDNPLRQRYGIDRELVVLYSGNMGIAHSFDGILAAAERLRGRRDIRFVFLGEGRRRREVEEACRARQLGNVSVAGLVPASELVYSQSLGDIHFVSLRPSFTGLVVPSKAYSTLAAGRALLYEGEAQGEIARMIVEEGIGAVVPMGDVEGMVRFIERMADERGACQALGRKARALSEGRYGRAAALGRYVDLLKGVGGIAGESGGVRGTVP